MAEQQAESWPVMVEGCTVLRVFHRGKWHARKGVAP
jgi:hypothetical protein